MAELCHENLNLCGRKFKPEEIQFIQTTVHLFPNLSLKELASTLCENMAWPTTKGKPRTESCLEVLKNLETQGLLQLPIS